MSLIPVGQLNPSFRQGAILARVSRMWDYCGGRDDGEIQHVDLVLVDKEGSAIYAEIGPDDIESKKPLLTEENIYVLKRFRVVNAKKSYRAVDFPYMINITCYTIIENCPAPVPAIPMYVYKLTCLSEIPSLSGETKSFVVHLQNQPKPTQRRAITIRDNKHFEIKMFIWGRRATEFEADEIYAMSQEKPVVALFVGFLAKPYKGDVCLSGNTACRWYIDSNIPECRMFLDSIMTDLQPIMRTLPTPATNISEQPLPDPELRNLQEIKNTNPYDFPQQGFSCTVTISKFNADQNWWFPSCNRCSRSSIQDGGGYKCPRDQCTGYKFKYKLCYTATDGDTETELIFFDDAGRRLIGKDVRVLMRSYHGSHETPAEIASQVGQKYQLTLNVTNKAFQSFKYSYEVKKINFGYGRQPFIPMIPPPVRGSGTQKNKNASPSVPSSSTQGSEETQAAVLMLETVQSPQKYLIQAASSATPVSTNPMLQTLIQSTEQPGKKTIEDHRTKPSQRCLFKDTEPVTTGSQDTDLSLEDSDDNDVDNPPHISDSDKPHHGTKKAPTLKKLKKN